MGLNESFSTIYSTQKPMLKDLKHDSERFFGGGRGVGLKENYSSRSSDRVFFTFHLYLNPV